MGELRERADESEEKGERRTENCREKNVQPNCENARPEAVGRVFLSPLPLDRIVHACAVSAAE